MVLTNNISIPSNYGFCVGVLGGCVWMNYYLQINVMQARKKFGVKPPTLYLAELPEDAEEKDKKRVYEYNCAQRAHQNTCESMALVMINMMGTGIMYPITSAVFGAVWVIGRVLYGYLYVNYPTKKSYGSFLWHLGEFPLGILAFKVAYDMLK